MSENPGPEDLETPQKEEQGTPGPDTGPGPPSSKPDHSSDTDEESGQVSEAGGSALNKETAEGGADAVPDTHG